MTAAAAIAVMELHPELEELHPDQRWRACCERCGPIGEPRYFRERAAMDGRQHTCESGVDATA